MNAVVKMTRTTEVAIPTTGKRLVVKAIEAMHAAYVEKGGLRESLARVEEQAAGVSRHIYSIAVAAAKRHRDVLDAATEFAALCVYAEAAFKKRHNVENLRDALPVWNVFKSNILRGMRMKLSPKDSATERAFRTRTMEEVAKLRGDSEDEVETPALEDDTSGAPVRAGPQPMDVIEQFVQTTSVRDPLKVLVAQLIFSAEWVKPTKVDQAQEILRRAWQEIGPLMSKRAAA